MQTPTKRSEKESDYKSEGVFFPVLLVMLLVFLRAALPERHKRKQYQSLENTSQQMQMQVYYKCCHFLFPAFVIVLALAFASHKHEPGLHEKKHLQSEQCWYMSISVHLCFCIKLKFERPLLVSLYFDSSISALNGYLLTGKFHR